jgi:hypothetical protein
MLGASRCLLLHARNVQPSPRQLKSAQGARSSRSQPASADARPSLNRKFGRLVTPQRHLLLDPEDHVVAGALAWPLDEAEVVVEAEFGDRLRL